MNKKMKPPTEQLRKNVVFKCLALSNIFTYHIDKLTIGNSAMNIDKHNKEQLKKKKNRKKEKERQRERDKRSVVP